MDDDERVHKRKAVTLTLIVSTHGAPIDCDRSSLRAAERRLSESYVMLTAIVSWSAFIESHSTHSLLVALRNADHNVVHINATDT